MQIRDEGTVKNKAAYPALGVTPDGTKEVPGMWVEQIGGAKFSLRVMSEPRHRELSGACLRPEEKTTTPNFSLVGPHA